MISRFRWPSGTLAALALLAAGYAARAGGAPASDPAGAPAGAPGAGELAVTAKTGDAEEAGRRWWAHVRYLADDRLQGRLTGTAGYLEAATYVAARFKEYGLEPAGTSGYFQPVRFEVQRVMAAESSLALVRDGREDPLALGRDALLGSREPQPREVAVTNRYHAPSDDVNQPVDLAAASHFNQLLLALAERVAGEEARPEWKPTSFFRRFAPPSAAH